MKQAALIIRVSTQTQNFERQIQDLTRLATDQGYTVSSNHIYAEKISGLADKKDRGAIIRLMADIKAGTKIDMCFATEVSRVARDPDTATEIIKDLMKLKVPVHIQNMQGIQSMLDGKENRMFFLILGILSHFAKSELEYISSRMRSGKKQNFKAGRNLGGGKMVYGYMLAEKDDEKKAAKLIINPVEAVIVKDIFKMTAEGVGQKAIANNLNERNIPTRSGVNEWQSGTIAQILEKEIYFGNRSYNIYGKDEDGNRVIIDTETYEGIVPAIITKAEFEAAKKASESRNVNPIRNIKYLYLLTGKLYCSHCGRLYSPKYRTGKVSHYGCSSKVNNKKAGINCDNSGIGISYIESLAWQMIRLRNELSDYLKGNDEQINQTKTDIQNLTYEIANYESEQSKKNEERLKLSKQNAKGIISDEEMDQQFGKIKTSINNLITKIAGARIILQSKRDWLASHNDISTITRKIRGIGVDRIRISEVLPKVLDKMIITSVGGSNTEWFIVTAFMFGSSSWSVLFNKKTLQMYHNPKADAMVKYNDEGLYTFDVAKVVPIFKQSYQHGGFKASDKIPEFLRKQGDKIKDTLVSPIIDVLPVPFKPLNSLNGLQEVPLRKIQRKKQYRKKLAK